MTQEKKKFSFKSLFLNEVPEETENKEKKEEVTQPTTPTVEQLQTSVIPAQVSNPVMVNYTPAGQVDEKILQTLCEVLEKNNVEGPDYLELKSILKNTEKLISDETTRIVSAYVSLKCNAPQLTKTHILETIDFYIQTIENERKEGLAGVAQLRAAEVETKIKSINEAMAKINALQEEIATLTQYINTTNMEVNKSKVEIDSKELNFVTTVDFLVNMLKNDKNKIEALINE
jgi:hypothetical protein